MTKFRESMLIQAYQQYQNIECLNTLIRRSVVLTNDEELILEYNKATLAITNFLNELDNYLESNNIELLDSDG